MWGCHALVVLSLYLSALCCHGENSEEMCPHVHGKAGGLQEVLPKQQQLLAIWKKMRLLETWHETDNKAVADAFLTCWLECGISLFSGICKKKSSSRLLTGTRRQIRIFSTADIPAFASLLIFLNVLALYFQPFNCVMLSLVVPRTALQQKGYTAFQINCFGQYKRPSLSYFNHILKTDFLKQNQIHCFNLLYTRFDCDLTKTR